MVCLCKMNFFTHGDGRIFARGVSRGSEEQSSCTCDPIESFGQVMH